jgi:hypothetical protein
MGMGGRDAVVGVRERVNSRFARVTGKVAPSTATVPERDVKRILQVLNREVPENFGYSGAYQVWRVEPSFIVRKRLGMRQNHRFCKLRILCEISVKK